MTEEQYIESGLLESYCLGALDANGQADVVQMLKLYPKVRAEFELNEAAFEHIALQLAVVPKTSVREKLMIDLFGLDLNNLPLIGSTSDLDAWVNALSHLIPNDKTEDFYHYLLQHDGLVTQSLVISKINIPDETHDDLIESFFILEGSCKCVINDKEYILNAGDFLEIPLHQHHDVVLLTPYVVAIHQQLALQAA